MTSTTLKESGAAGVSPPTEVEVARLGQALRRLHDVLPLAERRQSLDKPLRDLHRAILRSLCERGAPLTRTEIAEFLGGENAAARAIALLGSLDLVVRGELTVRDAVTNQLVILDARGGEIAGAYPMTTEETPHKVTIGNHSVYAMCAVDALAIGAIFATEATIHSRCHVSGEPVSIRQRRKAILDASPSGVRIGVRWQRLVGCAAHALCRQMIFLKDQATALAWLDADPLSKELFTLPEAVEFADAFFRPLLED